MRAMAGGVWTRANRPCGSRRTPKLVRDGNTLWRPQGKHRAAVKQSPLTGVMCGWCGWFWLSDSQKRASWAATDRIATKSSPERTNAFQHFQIFLTRFEAVCRCRRRALVSLAASRLFAPLVQPPLRRNKGGHAQARPP